MGEHVFNYAIMPHKGTQLLWCIIIAITIFSVHCELVWLHKIWDKAS